ncbi:MFS transporter [Pseudonocardia sp. ICBG601]|uniref:MFS transporter n=1 Tax=Pseudonocardia sp. ICBG601 TaxID=2846759 RepID=UPI001CF68A01|nr:MFS transporter [Pseudonocardia sp. ICBG601]
MSVPVPGAPVVSGPPAAETPTGRLISAMFLSNASAFVGLLTPLQLLLTLHLTRIEGPGAAAAFGVVTGFGAVFALVANPLGGRISDRTAARFGRRRTWILTGSLAGALVVGAIGFTTEVWQVAVLWCAAQTLFNFQLAATSALMADQVPQARRGTASGMLGLAAALGPLAGIGAVSAVRDPLLQWAVAAVAVVLLGLLALALIRERPLPGRTGAAQLGAVELMTSLWLNPRRHPAFGWAWLVRFLLACGVASATYNAFFLMDRFGLGTDEVGGPVLVLAVINVAMPAVSSAVAGPVSDRLGRQKPFAVAAGVLAAVALVLMALATTLWVVYVAVTLLGIATGLMVSVDTAMCVRVLPSRENAGKDLGVVNMANTLPQSIVPFVAPALLALGGFTAVYLVLAVVAVLGGVAVLRIPEIGREGDPRWAPITRDERAPA